VDGDNRGRKQRLLVRGKTIAAAESFAGAGVQVDIPLTTEDTKDGRVEVAVERLNEGSPNVVVSMIELWAVSSGSVR
jgi:hypothetical protein